MQTVVKTEAAPIAVQLHQLSLQRRSRHLYVSSAPSC